MSELVLLKLGGSLITDKTKPETARVDVIRRIAQEIKRALTKRGDIKLIIGHGGGSFPHYPAKRYRVNEGIINKDSWRGFAETRAAASKLNQIVTEIFLEEGLDVVSLQPSSSVLCENGVIVHMDLRQIKFLIDRHQIPVTYGDAVLDREKGCTIVSTEALFDYIARKLFPDRIILAGEVEGVYDSDPHKNPNAKLIPEITNKNFEKIKKMLTGSHGYDVTGGMATKIESMYNLLHILPSMKVQIISGKIPGVIEKAIVGREHIGTIMRYLGKSKIPKIIVVEVNGIIVKNGFKPWKEALTMMVERGDIPRDAWEREIKPIVDGYLSKKIDRDEAVKLVMMGVAKALKGKPYKEIEGVINKTMEKVRQNYDPFVIDMLKYAKNERGYKLATISANFYDIAKHIAKDIGAEYVYDTTLGVKNGKLTGTLKGEFMTSVGKLWAVRDLMERAKCVKERMIYIGNRISDWKAMNECGISILYKPDLSVKAEKTLEEKEWIKEILKVMRTNELSNLIVISNKSDTKKLKEIIDR
ncbi:MAG: haloacid dehalogenase-like hydrolase [Candidatus Diapherotrites archaeon]|nr:haloacid dehalogenase-like hydrolase [Candidatus Diapherotrites archaeon]